MKLCAEWSEFSDLTIFEAAYLLIRIDPKQINNDEDYADYCHSLGWDVDASEKHSPLLSAVRSKEIETTGVSHQQSGEFDPRKTFLLKSSFITWCKKHDYEFVAEALSNAAQVNLSNPSEHPSREEHDWKKEAKIIAQRLGQEKWDSGTREITARNSCEPVAKELAKDPKYYGNRGARSASDIRTRGLKGWKFIPKAVDQMEQTDQTGSNNK